MIGCIMGIYYHITIRPKTTHFLLCWRKRRGYWNQPRSFLAFPQQMTESSSYQIFIQSFLHGANSSHLSILSSEIPYEHRWYWVCMTCPKSFREIHGQVGIWIWVSTVFLHHSGLTELTPPIFGEDGFCLSTQMWRGFCCTHTFLNLGPYELLKISVSLQSVHLF